MLNTVYIRQLIKKNSGPYAALLMLTPAFLPATSMAAVADAGAVQLSVARLASTEISEEEPSNDSEAQRQLKSIENTQQALRQLQDELEQRLSQTQKTDSPAAKAAHYWRTMTERGVTSNEYLNQLRARYERVRTQVQQNGAQAIADELQQIERDYLSALHNFEAAQHLFDAKRSAQKARMDFNMYRMMKHVDTKGPEAKRAEQLLTEANGSLEAANLTLALEQFKAAAKAFNVDAFSEVLDGFKTAGDSAKAKAAKRLAEIKNEVNRLLENAFVIIPAGKFAMGNANGSDDEKPARTVSIPEFKLGKNEISFSLWDLCVEVRTCPRKPADEQWGRGARPVINVSFNDITLNFIPWLNQMTDKQYRLPSEAEWEYAARSQSNPDAPYSWGEDIDCSRAQYDGGFGSGCPAQTANGPRGTAEVMTFQASSLGLYDMHGNVWEWVQDCYANSYAKAPSNGSAVEAENCDVGVLRGGAWNSKKDALIASNRFYFPRTSGSNSFGFRLVEVSD